MYISMLFSFTLSQVGLMVMISLWLERCFGKPKSGFPSLYDATNNASHCNTANDTIDFSNMNRRPCVSDVSRLFFSFRLMQLFLIASDNDIATARFRLSSVECGHFYFFRRRLDIFHEWRYPPCATARVTFMQRSDCDSKSLDEYSSHHGRRQLWARQKVLRIYIYSIYAFSGNDVLY